MTQNKHLFLQLLKQPHLYELANAVVSDSDTCSATCVNDPNPAINLGQSVLYARHKCSNYRNSSVSRYTIIIIQETVVAKRL
jgi:hypothetical protein